MTTTLLALLAPHPPRDLDKLGRLIEAYRLDEAMTPVVVLEFVRGAYALCGSHRIAAMREVYEEDITIEDLAPEILVLDGDALYEEEPETRYYLDRLLDGRFDFDGCGDLGRLRPYLTAGAQEALDDQ